MAPTRNMSDWRLKILDDESRKDVPENVKYFLATSVRAIATTIIHPIEVIKIRVQLCPFIGEKLHLASLRGIIAKEGFSILYCGISAGVLSQIISASTRMAVYSLLNNHIKAEDDKLLSFSSQLALEVYGMICGALVSAPTELVLVRMAADTCLPKHKRKGYKHVIDALARIRKDEGTTSLWRATIPIMFHAISGRTTGIMCHPFVHQGLKVHFDDGLHLHVVASMIVEFFCSIIALPSDIVKTKLQGMGAFNDTKQFVRPLDALKRIVNKGNILSLWRGFIPYYIRRSTHTVLTIILLDYGLCLYVTCF